VELIAVLFFFLSLLPISGLVYWVATTETVMDGGGGLQDIIWNFVSTLGIVRPSLLIFASGMLVRLSFSLRQGQVAGIRWAKLVASWLIILVGILTSYQFYRAGSMGISTREIFAQNFPYAIIFLLAFGVYRAVIAANPSFVGDEDILSKRTRNAWNLLTPTLVVFLLIAITPLERVFITSLTDERFASSSEVNFVGLENYADLWSVRLDIIPCTTDDNGNCATEIDSNGNEVVTYLRPRRFFPDDSDYVRLRYRDMGAFDIGERHFVISARDTEFIDSFVTSFYYTILATFFQFTIGFMMAMVSAQQVRGIGILRLAMLVPMAIPTLIATQFWSVMLRPDETGLINFALLRTGLIDTSLDWLLNPALQVPTLVAVIVWRETPIVALLLLPGLLSIPREVYQAAAIDGANQWQRFWQITMPMMRATIGVALVLRTMVFIRVFDLFEILVGRTRFVMSTYTHDVLIQRQQLGYASAVSVTIFIITMLFTIAYMRGLRIDEA
jgi:trehalose/maltose transport system permease protein